MTRRAKRYALCSAIFSLLGVGSFLGVGYAHDHALGWSTTMWWVGATFVFTIVAICCAIEASDAAV